MATDITATQAAERARERLLNRLHPSIRAYVRAVNEMGRRVEARDLDGVVRAWVDVQVRLDDYLKEWER